MKSIKAEMSITMIITVVIALLVLFLYVFAVIMPAMSKGGQLSKCTSLGGVLIKDSCNSKLTHHLTIGDDEDGNFCCRKKSTVNETEYDKWLESAPVVQTEKKSDDESEKISSHGVQERVDATIIDSESILLTFGDKIYEKGIPLVINSGESFLTTGIHSYEKGNYCLMYVTEAEQVPDGWRVKRVNGKIIYLPGTTVRDFECKPVSEKGVSSLSQLQIVSSISKPGFYKVDYVVKNKKDGLSINSATFVFEVSGTNKQINYDNKETKAPVISITETRSSRDGIVYCFVDIDVTNFTNHELPPYTLQSAQTTKGCIGADYSPFSITSSSKIDEGKIFCLKTEQTFTGIDGREKVISKQKSFDYSYCNNIQIIERNKGSTCVETCESFSSNLERCVNFNARLEACEFSLDCYIKQKLTSKTCLPCDSDIESCTDYKNEESCTSNQCLINSKCKWADGNLWALRRDRCVPI